MAPLLQLLISTVALLFASTLVAVGSAEAPSSSSSPIYRLELIHVDANGGFTKDELIRRAERRSRIRAAALSDDDGDWTAAASTTGDDDTYMGEASYSGGEYLMELGIGTPKKPFKAVVDTGSDVIWTKEMERCSPGFSSSFASSKCSNTTTSRRYCNRCDGEVCVFSKIYGSSKMKTKGFMARESLTLPCVGGAMKKVGITFGCAEECRDDKGDNDCHRLIPAFSDGIVGLSMSPRSLLSQLRVTRFSYCLSNQLEPKLRSPIWFGGDKLSLGGGGGVQTTPLVSSWWAEPPSVWAYRYYVELEAISIIGDDGKLEALDRIPEDAFNHRSNNGTGKGLMFVDSGCSYSKLETAAYNVLKNLLAKELNSEPFLNKDNFTCFKHASGQPKPEAVLHLTGAKMRLRWSSYMHETKEEPEHSCLTIKDTGTSISILGNFQQQNMRMLYDMDAKNLQFVPVDDCSTQE